MKNLITSILMLVSILGFSQQKFDLLLDEKNAVTFNDANGLERACQIYFFEKIDSNSFVLFNDYLRFEFTQDSISYGKAENIYGKCKMSFQGIDDGTFNCTLNKSDQHWYILKFIQDNGGMHYYFFYRRWEFLEKYWPSNSREIRPISSVPSTVGNSN
jgi:hypothetical protein